MTIEAEPTRYRPCCRRPAAFRASDSPTGPRSRSNPGTLSLGGDGVLRCTVKGDHPARFTRAGQLALGALLQEDPPGSGGFALVVNGRRWPVRAPG